MGRGDLENRDAEAGLGELPEDIADESGMLSPLSQSAAIPHAPADVLIADKSRGEEKRTGLGAPLLDFTVRSTYDSRPVQGYDFNVYATAAIPDDGLGVTPLAVFTVPEGYAAVLRRIEVWIINGTINIPNLLRPDFLVSLTLNATEVANNRNIPMGAQHEIETFVIADQFDVLGVLGRFAAFIAGIGATPNLHVQFYGNLLLKTGRPATMEIANLAGREKPRDPVAATDLAAFGIDAEAAQREAGMVSRPRRRPRDPYRGVPLLKR